jgi:hypothetical protein
MRSKDTRRILERLRGEMSMQTVEAIRMGLTHERMMDRMAARVWTTHDYERLPGWAKSELDGFRAGLMAGIWRDHVEWRVELDGEMILSEDVPTGRWQDVGAGRGAFYWRATRLAFSPADAPPLEQEEVTDAV